MKKKKLPSIEITELYLIKADWERTFMAQIYREMDQDGEPIVHGKVTVNEGKIWSYAETLEELAQNLDEICILKLDRSLHANARVVTQIFDDDFFLN